VGWGGATDQDNYSSSIVWASGQGVSLVLEGCTLQYHSESRHPLETFLVVGQRGSRVSLSQCRLVGPAPGNVSTTGFVAQAQHKSTVTLVSCAQVWLHLVCTHWHVPIGRDVGCTACQLKQQDMCSSDGIAAVSRLLCLDDCCSIACLVPV
jgi:hypothetical protein